MGAFFIGTWAGAHPALFTSAEIYIQPDGRYQFFTTFDLLAFALHKTSVEIGDPPMNALLDGPPATLNAQIEQARAYFRDHTRLQTDRGPASVTRLQFPDLQEVENWKTSGKTPRLPVVARVEIDGALPVTASRVQFQFPATLGTVVLTVNRPGDDVYDGMIDPGFVSGAVPIRLDRSGAGAPDGTSAEVESKHLSPKAGHLLFLTIGCIGLLLALCLGAYIRMKKRSRRSF